MVLVGVATAAILIGAAAYSLAFRPRGVLLGFLTFSLLSWSACVVSVGLAGTVLRLTPATLVLLAVLWAASGSALAWRSGLRETGSSFRTSAATFTEVARWPPVAAALLLVGASLIWRTVLAVRLPTADVLGWQYHMVIADVWIQSESIVRVPQNIWTDGWPATGELLTAWFMTLTHSDSLAGFTGLAPLPVAMIATAGMARELGASRRTASLAGLLLGMTPAWLALAGTSYPDPGFAAAVVACWWMGLRILRGSNDVLTGLLFGIAAGLSLGIKGSALVLIGPALVAVAGVLIARLVRAVRRPGGIWPVIGAGTAVIVPTLLLGVSWYLRNLLTHGNPLYPVGFGPFPGLSTGEYGAPPVPRELAELDGIARVFRSWIHDWHLDRYLYNVRPGGFGHAWAAGIALASVGLGILADRRRIVPFLLIVLPTAIGLALLYSPWYARYTLFVPALAWAAAAIALDRLRHLPRTIASILLVAAAGVSVVLANAAPNVLLDVPGAHGERSFAGRSAAYVQLVVTGSRADRTAIALVQRCEGMRRIPPGSRVAVASRFFVPHAVVGGGLRRTLVQPPPPDAPTLAAFKEYVRLHDVDWLVTVSGTDLDMLVSDNEKLFEPEGRSCHRSRLWRVRAMDPSAANGPRADRP